MENQEPKKLKFTRYKRGLDTFNYFENEGKMYEISSIDSTVRVMSIKEYRKLVFYYNNNDNSDYDIDIVNYSNVEEKRNDEEKNFDSHEDYYVFNTPHDLLK
jgi:hypothetical protein